ncbi:MAG: DUF192 domain-containing protein [Chloroflexia bacterium]
MNRTTGEVLARRVIRCETFLEQLRGLMFRARLAPDEVYFFRLERESRLEAAIHMFFVFFPIAVIWLDREGRVVGVREALPWRPFYAPPRPAAAFLEGDVSLLQKVRPGDILDIT